MSEQDMRPEVLPGDLITRVGLYEARCGDIVRITGWRDGWWVSISNGVRTYYGSDGRLRFPGDPDTGRWQLLHWVGPLPESEPEPETTSEQLAQIEGQADYALPEGCRNDGGWSTTSGIEPEPWPKPQPQPVQVREGRWRTRAEEIVSVTATPADHEDFSLGYPWWDGERTWANDGRFFWETLKEEDLVEYLGPIEPEPEPQPEAQPQPESDAEQRIRLLRAAIDAADKQLDQKDAQIRDLRIELDAAQQVPRPVTDEERERIWDDATEQAGREVIRWLRPLTMALTRQPDERFCRFAALTLSVLPDVLPELLGYAVEDESEDCEE